MPTTVPLALKRLHFRGLCCRGSVRPLVEPPRGRTITQIPEFTRMNATTQRVAERGAIAGGNDPFGPGPNFVYGVT